jgi:hypothetical protein
MPPVLVDSFGRPPDDLRFETLTSRRLSDKTTPQARARAMRLIAPTPIGALSQRASSTPAPGSGERVVANAITRRVAEKRRKDSSDDAVSDACLWATAQQGGQDR